MRTRKGKVWKGKMWGLPYAVKGFTGKDGMLRKGPRMMCNRRWVNKQDIGTIVFKPPGPDREKGKEAVLYEVTIRPSRRRGSRRRGR